MQTHNSMFFNILHYLFFLPGNGEGAEKKF